MTVANNPPALAGPKYEEHVTKTAQASFISYVTTAIEEIRAGGPSEKSQQEYIGANNLLRFLVTGDEPAAIQSMLTIEATPEWTERALKAGGLAPLAEGELEQAMPLARQKTLQGIADVNAEVIGKSQNILAAAGIQLQTLPPVSGIINPQTTAANDAHIANQLQNQR